MDQATSWYQVIPLNLRERSKNPTKDCRFNQCAGRHYQEKALFEGFPLNIVTEFIGHSI